MNKQTDEPSIDTKPQTEKTSTNSLSKIKLPLHFVLTYYTKFRDFLNLRMNTRLYFSMGLLIVISLMPWVSEVTVNRQVYAEILEFSDPLDPIKAGQLAEKISKYTPGIKENSQDVTISLMIESDNYTLAQQLALNANKNLEAPERQQATYVVRGGETITQIAEKFDLHVQSILDANSIKPEDTKKIREGYVLNIPSSDTSTSSDWLVAIKRAEDEARAKAAEEAAKKAASRRLASSRALAASTQRTSSGYSSVDNSGIITPISHRGISQHFGRGHTGIDYMANVGTPIMAAASGKVVIISSGWSGGYGNQIVIDHGGGRATRYAHLSTFNVSSGETVSKGQIIAYSGNTGRSTGPHLHFELIIGGRPVNPH